MDPAHIGAGNSCTKSVSRVEFPESWGKALDDCPDIVTAETLAQIDALIIRYYGKKPVARIADACGRSQTMLHNRIKKLKELGAL